jgi:hypothetical protein
MLYQEVEIFDKIKNQSKFLRIVPDVNQLWMGITDGIYKIKNT